MTRYRYSPKSLTGDYLRAAGGFAITGGPVLFLQTAMPVAAILGALAALFGIFGLRTARRQFTVIEMSNDAITLAGAERKRLDWRDVRQLRLDYFSTRRDSQGGWMQMKITGSGGKIRIDSSLDGFVRLAEEIAAHATAHGVDMSKATQGNFRALGIKLPADGMEAGR